MLSRQSVMESSQKAKPASAIVPTTGIAIARGVVIFLMTPTTAPTVISVANTLATMRNSSRSSSSLGKITMMAAPSSAPERVLRPPMMTASRNSTVSSKL